MAAKTVKIEKGFDAVAFMRKQRDRISKDISNMDFEEIKEYFAKKKGTAKRTVSRKTHTR